MARYPTAFGHALGATDLAVRGAIEVAIAGKPDDDRCVALARAVASEYAPSLVLAGGSGDASIGIALLADRERHAPTAYVCRSYACDAPTTDPHTLRDQLVAARTILPA
jgi:uncharacterized protein YyaL (SSP411 family)